MSKLVIRYANPDTIPSTYPSQGWTKSGMVTTDDYWTLTGEMWALTAHVEKALADNNLNDYTLVRD